MPISSFVIDTQKILAYFGREKATKTQNCKGLQSQFVKLQLQFVTVLFCVVFHISEQLSRQFTN